MNKNPQQILADLTATTTESILHAVGKSSVESIFLAGSIAEGRIAYFEENDHVEIYSDLDLYVVVSADTDIPTARARARSIIPALPLATAGYTIYRTPDIGVFNESDLLAQPHRPGTVEIPICYRMLYGREDIAEKTRCFDVTLIGREEALYLLENRLLEAALPAGQPGADRPDGIRRSIYYTSLKQCLDVVSAVLIADGVFVCGLHDRMSLFRGRSDATGIVVDKHSLDTIEYAYEHIQDLQRSIHDEMENSDGVRERSEVLILTAWKNIAASLYKKAPLIGWDTLLGIRCRGESLVNNLRETVRISRSCGRGARTGMKLWSKHPTMRLNTLLRLAGLCEILASYPDRGLGAPPKRPLRYLDGVTDDLGFSEGTILERARALYETIS